MLGQTEVFGAGGVQQLHFKAQLESSFLGSPTGRSQLLCSVWEGLASVCAS